MSPARLMALSEKGFAATLPRAGAGGTASSLASEVLNDGSSNCLERAYESARPGDQVLLYADADDPVGHAVVQRPDGSIVDPNEPGKVYASRAEWEAAHAGYHRPVSVSHSHLRQVFAQPPGPGREAVLRKLGLSSIAHRQVADGVTPERQDVLRSIVEQFGSNARTLEDIFAGKGTPGALTREEKGFLMGLLVERSLSSGDGGQVFRKAGHIADDHPAMAMALGHAFEQGAVTPEQLERLMGPEGMGMGRPSEEFARLVAASGSVKLQTEMSSRLWAQAGGDLWGQAVALMATGGAGEAIQQLIDTAGVDAVAQPLVALGADTGSGLMGGLSGTALGNLMSGLAELPRSEATDRLAATVFLSLPPVALQRNSQVRIPVAQYLASIRYPGNDAAQQGDLRTWNTLLQNRYASELLFNPALPVEARQGNLLFFLQRPNFDVALLDTFQGNLGSVAAAEVQQALGNLDPASVNAAAELPPVPAELAGRFPAIANLPQPVTAEGLQGSIPSPITPSMAADYLDALADSVAATGNPDMTRYVGGPPALAALFNVFVGGNPIERANLDDFSAIGVSGLRDLARQLRGSSDPVFVAQALTLGGIQHDAYFDNLQPFVDSVIAQKDQVLGNMTVVRQLAQAAFKTGASAVAMAAGGPILAAGVNAAVGAAFAQYDAHLEGRTLALPNLIGGAVVDFGLGMVVPLLDNGATKSMARKVLEGMFEALGGHVADAVRDPAKLEELWNSGQGDDELLKVIILGTFTGIIPWERFTTRFEGQLITSLGVKREATEIAADALKMAAVEASNLWLDPEIQARLRSGALTPEQAVQQMREQGINLFGTSTASADPAITEAMLRVLMSGPETP
ncbi:hypothetical protein HPC49_06450 [Pyxidicoccus fallax]|uniref:Uncharacterized protein n=1 Tax=Pyxidicoccus fallax TaxID=394095 RepID=A0A848LI64_9BACT|nr:hypothetical protein [Pyxidicoccus fallax]NMO17407.1 hypothetical protein [Pyxidicoccus fallax]NPC77894.1 hypothetical protein [Pyxidicoccus fallax]